MALAAVLAAVPSTALAQYNWCGEEQYGVQLRFHNPDLNPWNDPVPDDHPIPNDPEIVETSWHVLIQFQAVVDEAHEVARDMDLLHEIESFWFGFGPLKEAAVAGPLDNCDKPWAPGIQLYSTFSDTTVEDGFHLGLNTTLVPDGGYGAIVYACTESTADACKPDGDDDLVAAAWSRVQVYNGEDRCLPKELPCMRQVDFVQPWPRILPGDGDQTSEAACEAAGEVPLERCLTVEFSEDIADVRLFVNGVNRSGELAFWQPPRDDPTSRLGYSEWYVWEAPRAFEEHDEVRVRAVDGAGNVADKTISFRDATRGGVIPLVEADVEVAVDPDRQRIRPGEARTFEMTLRNRGNDTAHVYPFVRAPSSVEAKASDDHVDLAGGEAATVLLEAGPTADAEAGEYPVEVAFEYIAGNRRHSRKAFATVVADPDAPPENASGGGSGGPGAEGPPTGFTRQCVTEGGFQVCFVHPDELPAGRAFPVEVQVAKAAEDRTQRHAADAGDADLVVEHLSADGAEEVLPAETFPLEQTSLGRYRADVTLAELAPTVRAVFDAEEVRAAVVLREPADPAGGAGEGVPVPGFGALVAALGASAAAALLSRRRR